MEDFPSLPPQTHAGGTLVLGRLRDSSPMLTAVNIPIEEMGRHAAKLLLDRVAGNHQLPVKMILPNKLIVRESCGPAKNL